MNTKDNSEDPVMDIDSFRDQLMATVTEYSKYLSSLKFSDENYVPSLNLEFREWMEDFNAWEKVTRGERP